MTCCLVLKLTKHHKLVSYMRLERVSLPQKQAQTDQVKCGDGHSGDYSQPFVYYSVVKLLKNDVLNFYNVKDVGKHW